MVKQASSAPAEEHFQSDPSEVSHMNFGQTSTCFSKHMLFCRIGINM